MWIKMWLIGMAIFALCLLIGVGLWIGLGVLMRCNSARKIGQDNQDAATDSEKNVMDPLLQQEMTSSGFQACNRTDTDGSTMERAL